MATPVIQTQATSSLATGTSIAVNLPSGIQSGDLLLAVIVGNGATTYTFPAGWNNFKAETGANSGIHGFDKIADGTEGATVAVTSSTSTQHDAIVYRITGHDAAVHPEAGTMVSASNSASGNPPSLSPSWGSDTTLWFAISKAHTQTVVNTFPTSYVNTGVVTGNGVTDGLGYCNLGVTSAAEDPAAYTWAGTGLKRSNTFAVKPGVTAGAPVPFSWDRNGAMGALLAQ